jgi:uncharacterized membrane protein YdjX (TVP38/TMEM64 family)
MKNIFGKIYDYVRELGNLTPIAFVTTFLPMLGSTILLIIGIPLGYWLRENWEIGTLLYFLGVLIFCGLALLPTNVIGVIGGWAFNFDLGITILITGVVGAALISFLIHRRIVGEKLPQVFEKHPKAQAVYEALLEQNLWRTTLIIFLLRISVIMPFALTNFLMASARVPLRSYIAGTFFGMLPRSSAVVFVGAGLSELNFDNPQSLWLLIFGIAATIVSVIVISNISRHALERLTGDNAAV